MFEKYSLYAWFCGKFVQVIHIHYLPRRFLKLHASRWRIFKSPRYPPPWSAGGLLVESRWIVGDMPTNANCRWSADRNREKSVEGRQSRKAGGVTAIVKSSWCVDEIEVSTSLGDNRVYVREAEFWGFFIYFFYSPSTHIADFWFSKLPPDKLIIFVIFPRWTLCLHLRCQPPGILEH